MAFALAALGLVGACGLKGPLVAGARRRRRPAPRRSRPRRPRRALMRPARRARIAYRGGRFIVEGLAAGRPGAPLRHAALRLLDARRWRAPCPPTSARSPAATICSAMPSRRTRTWRCCSGSPAAAAASTSSPAASSSGCSPPAATRRGSSSPASARRAPRWRARSRVGVLCFNVESVGELERCSSAVAEPRRPARRGSACASIPTSIAKTHPYISTGLRGNKFGIAHERGAGGVSRAPRGCPASRWSASTATSARRSPRAAPYVDALDRLLDLVETRRGRRHRARPPRLGGGLGIAYDDETPPDAERPDPRACSSASTRAATARRKLLFEPGRSLVGNAGVLVSEVLYVKPGARPRTSASSTRR